MRKFCGFVADWEVRATAGWEAGATIRPGLLPLNRAHGSFLSPGRATLTGRGWCGGNYPRVSPGAIVDLSLRDKQFNAGG
jgi:hypothetical protein